MAYARKTDEGFSVVYGTPAPPLAAAQIDLDCEARALFSINPKNRLV